MSANEITLDNWRANEATVDNWDVWEITIDGCPIRFDKLYRSGWYLVEGGSASPTIDGTDWNEIIAAGIRWKGAKEVTSNTFTDWGQASAISGGGCSTASLPSIPSAPFGFTHGDYTGINQGRVYGSRLDDFYYSGTAELYIGGQLMMSASGVWALWPSMSLAIGALTGSGSVVGCVASNDAQYDVVGAVQARAGFQMTAYSAADPAIVEYHGGLEGEYTFWLSNNSLSPSGSGPLAFRISDVYQGPESNLDDWFYFITFPELAFTPGVINTLNIKDILALQKVYVEVFVVYR